MPDHCRCYPMWDRADKPRPFPSGSLRTSQDASKYMVARVSAVYAGQCGRPLWLGFPVRANSPTPCSSVLTAQTQPDHRRCSGRRLLRCRRRTKFHKHGRDPGDHLKQECARRRCKRTQGRHPDQPSWRLARMLGRAVGKWRWRHKYQMGWPWDNLSRYAAIIASASLP